MKFCSCRPIFDIYGQELLKTGGFFSLVDLRDSNRDSELELVKIPCTLFVLDASLLAGQKSHFEGVKMKD